MSRHVVAKLERAGIGRMLVSGDNNFHAYSGERWGFDCGTFPCWKNETVWSPIRFERDVAKAEQRNGVPYLAVLPDVPAGGLRSLDLSMWWAQSGRLPDWPWFLAVQDGMTVDDVTPVMSHVAGLFLGGSDQFKQTASSWREITDRFHYARAGTLRKLRTARRSGADSADSAFPLWTVERLDAFIEWSNGDPQREMFA